MGFLDLVYPKKCLGCGRIGKYFCERCLGIIELSDECFNNHLSLFCYRGVMREAIKQLKFKFLKDIGAELKELINNGLEKKLTQPNTEPFREFLQLKPAVQPLPLFWYRQHWRGFNQAEIIAEIVAKKLKLDLTDSLERVKLTKPQSQLKRRERLTNVAGIFRAKPVQPQSAVLLVDDVWTTGATMLEAVKVIKTAGAGEVWGLSLAR